MSEKCLYINQRRRQSVNQHEQTSVFAYVTISSVAKVLIHAIPILYVFFLCNCSPYDNATRKECLSIFSGLCLPFLLLGSSSNLTSISVLLNLDDIIRSFLVTLIIYSIGQVIFTGMSDKSLTAFIAWTLQTSISTYAQIFLVPIYLNSCDFSLSPAVVQVRDYRFP